MNERHRELHGLLATLGDHSRFRIVLGLLERTRSVGEIAVVVGLSQSCTTRHVQALERRGIVSTRRDGKRVLVSITRESLALAALLDWVGEHGEPGSVATTEARRPPPTPASRRERATRARTGEATPTPASAGQDRASASAPPSGKNPAPSAPEVPAVRRVPQQIEDYLL